MSGNYFSTDTIVAIATSMAGDAGVGVVRLSGPDALKAARATCRGLEAPQARYLHRIEVIDGITREVIDDGLGVVFPKGHSFTGEEVVELQLHGGRCVLQAALRTLLATGFCRMALPGEFSFRAVREGRLTLSGAEALGQLVSARSMFEVAAARRAIGQARREEFDGIAAKLRELLALSELSIDFSDQDVEVISTERLKSELENILAREEEILAQMEQARRIAEGVRVTLVGEPNVGKSTLFNALISEDRAIVSSEAGTTRDVITEDFQLGPYRVRLADTAGVRQASSTVEREGIDRAVVALSESDLVVLIVDANGESFVQGGRLTELFEMANGEGCEVLVAINKCDQVGTGKARDTAKEIETTLKARTVAISARSGEGLGELMSELRLALDRRLGSGMHGFLPTEFQIQMLVKSRSAIREAADVVKTTGLSHPELISAGLTAAVRALSDLVGETTPDTVLAKIFSEFCIGK